MDPSQPIGRDRLQKLRAQFGSGPNTARTSHGTQGPTRLNYNRPDPDVLEPEEIMSWDEIVRRHS